MFNLKSLLAIGTILVAATPALSQSVVKINALGDSITGSPGCWRGLLWQKLQAAGVKNTDFVGTRQPDGCGFNYDGQHDGHGGFLATGIVRDNQLPGWLAISQPDIVMMELGTNDVWGGMAPATIVKALDTLVDQMRAQKSSMRVLVAQITPMKPTGCAECPARVVAYNAAIAAWAPTKSTATSPITVVDVWTGYDTNTDTVDGVHPNNNGNVKLANSWFGPLKAEIALASGGSVAASSARTTLATSTVPRSSVKPTTMAPSSSSIASVKPTTMAPPSSTIASLKPSTMAPSSSTTPLVIPSSACKTRSRTTAGATSATPSVKPSACKPRSSTTTVATSAAATSAATTSAATTKIPVTGPLAQRWAQCGGKSWTGVTACVSPSVCQMRNQWYSQCV